MVNLIRAFVLLVTLLAGQAFALEQKAVYEASAFKPSTGLKKVTADTPTLACNAIASALGLQMIACGNAGNPNALSGQIALRDDDFENYNGNWEKKIGCPANSEAINNNTSCQCKAGFEESAGSCTPEKNNCAASTGKTGIVNWTQGYSRTPDEGDIQAVGKPNPPPADGNFCESGCMVSAQTSGPGVTFYVSQQPTAQGLYRRSVDYPTVGLGTKCTASNAAPNSPVAPEPKCEGTVGQVNGKNVCVGTPASPVVTTPMTPPTNTPIAGNPAAGPKPETGEGSGTGSTGRTPDAGTGGNAGGSASAGVGGKGGSAGGTSSGTGTVKTPATGETQAACGAPGQPVCDVKIKEEGTKEKGDFSEGVKALDQVEKDAKSAFDQAHTIQQPIWTFTFQFPTGCSPYDTGIRGFVLNPCKYQSTIHDLMSMVWAAVTCFCIIGMVGRTIREA